MKIDVSAIMVWDKFFKPLSTFFCIVISAIILWEFCVVNNVVFIENFSDLYGAKHSIISLLYMGQSIQEWTTWNLWKIAFKQFEVIKQTVSL